MRKRYPTDLSDAEWSCIEPHLPTPRAAGRPRRHSLREILDAIFYIVRSGCAWRLLPHEFPPWKTISITTSGFGASMVPGSDYTLPYATVCEYDSKEILNQAQA
jgi:transposase